MRQYEYRVEFAPQLASLYRRLMVERGRHHNHVLLGIAPLRRRALAAPWARIAERSRATVRSARGAARRSRRWWHARPVACCSPPYPVRGGRTKPPTRAEGELCVRVPKPIEPAYGFAHGQDVA